MYCQAITFGSIKLTIAPEYAAIRGRITAIQCILVVEVNCLFQGCLCRKGTPDLISGSFETKVYV